MKTVMIGWLRMVMWWDSEWRQGTGVEQTVAQPTVQPLEEVKSGLITEKNVFGRKRGAKDLRFSVIRLIKDVALYMIKFLRKTITRKQYFCTVSSLVFLRPDQECFFQRKFFTFSK